MISAEWTIVLVNAVVLCVAYFWMYPRFAKADMNRLLINDLLANCTALLVAGLLFQGTGQKFEFVIFELGWFGFTLITFVLMELPFFWSYARRYRLFEVASGDDRQP